MIPIKNEQEINIMRRNGQVLALILKKLENATKSDISTFQLEELANKLIFNYGYKPSFKGYNNYPAALCVSLNDEIVHALPHRNKVVKKGDIVTIDLGICKDGFHVDSAISFAIPPIQKNAAKLLLITKKSLALAIKSIRPDIKLGQISSIIQKTIENHGFSVIKDLVGHGIGKKLHEKPSILNYGSPKTGPILKEGMVLAIEPMASLGSDQIKKSSDNFGYLTKDNSLAAHFEHTVLVTKNGAEILTQ